MKNKGKGKVKNKLQAFKKSVGGVKWIKHHYIKEKTKTVFLSQRRN